MTKNSFGLRSASAAAIIGLTLAMGTPVAMAQTTTPSPVITKDTGTLTIHKYANPTTTGTPTGNKDNSVSGTPLDGVEFKIFKIDSVDMKTNEGLKAAAALTPSSFQYNAEKGTVAGATQVDTAKTTENGGQIVLTDLPIGAYFVVETKPVAGYAPAAPFIAFVPMTDGNAANGGTSWNYDVHAYPKNYNTTADKKVEDSNDQAGGTVDFTITSDVPALADATTKISKYVIVDDLQENLITTTASQISVDGFDAGTDYTIAPIGTDQKVTITFTASGLDKLTTNKRTNSNYKVVTHIKANVLAPTATGVLKNTATIISNNGSGSGDTTTDTNETDTYWGNVKITKKEAGSDELLQGAEFAIYSPGTNGICEPADLTGDAISALDANGAKQTTWVTDANGTVTIRGLHANDFEDAGSEGSKDQAPVYCLFETKSPAGYELLSKPITLTLKKKDIASAGAATKPAVYTLAADVENLKDTTPKLPMTGGTGIGLLAAIGAALVGAGAWFARRNSNKA